MKDIIHITFTNIYEETYHEILKYVISKCDNLSSVEEIMQEIYLTFYQQLKKDSSYIKEYKTFLYKLAKNELFKYYSIKNKFKFLLKLNLDDDLDLIENISDETINIQENIENQCDLKDVWNAIKELNLTTQKIITLYYLEDMKIKEIAKLLNTNESTIKSSLYRGVQKIKDKVNGGKNNE